MARYERAPRAEPGPDREGVTPKVTMALGPDGTFHAVQPPRELIAEQERRPAPPTADDPRTNQMRNTGPYGGAV